MVCWASSQKISTSIQGNQAFPHQLTVPFNWTYLVLSIDTCSETIIYSLGKTVDFHPTAGILGFTILIQTGKRETLRAESDRYNTAIKLASDLHTLKDVTAATSLVDDISHQPPPAHWPRSSKHPCPCSLSKVSSWTRQWSHFCQSQSKVKLLINAWRVLNSPVCTLNRC